MQDALQRQLLAADEKKREEKKKRVNNCILLYYDESRDHIAVQMLPNLLMSCISRALKFVHLVTCFKGGECLYIIVKCFLILILLLLSIFLFGGKIN